MVLIVGGYMVECCEYCDMVFMKDLDVVSLLLYQYVLGGMIFGEVIIEFFCVDGEGNCVKYFEVKLKNVILSEVDL